MLLRIVSILNIFGVKFLVPCENDLNETTKEDGFALCDINLNL